MLRAILAVLAGFATWMLAWFGGEKILSALLPTAFGVHQKAFEEVLEKGGQFAPDATFLLMHIGLAAVVTLIAGLLAAKLARNNRRAVLALGLLLTAMGVMKAVMSWHLVPLWYHIAFTALLLPLILLASRFPQNKTI